jgi:hypothetical protein
VVFIQFFSFYCPFYLPLHVTTIFFYRAVVLLDMQGNIVACADIGYASAPVTRYATFANEEVQGYIRLRQGADNTSETGIYVNVYSPKATADTTVSGLVIAGHRVE